MDLLLGTSLKKIWSIVNILQFIVFFHFIKVSIAAHSSVFLSKLKIIALGEFFPYEEITNEVEEKFNIDVDKYFRSDIIEQLGSTFVMGEGLGFFGLALVMLGLLRKCCNEKIGKTFDKLKEKVFWNAFIRYTLQSYLKLALVSITALKAMSS